MTNIATASIRFGADGTDVILRDIQAREDRIADVSPAWPAVRAVLHELIAEAFDTEGASTEAGAWSPLKPATQRERARLGYGPAHPILERAGTLRRSVTGLGGGYSIETGAQLIEMTTVAYFGPHQRTRPMVAPTEEQRQRIFQPIRLYLWGRDATARDAR
jgi:hypothetical protein